MQFPPAHQVYHFLHLGGVAEGGEIMELVGEGGQQHQGIGGHLVEGETQQADTPVLAGGVDGGVDGGLQPHRIEADVRSQAVADLPRPADGVLLLRVNDVGRPHLQRLGAAHLQRLADHHLGGPLYLATLASNSPTGPAPTMKTLSPGLSPARLTAL